ncbi:MAG: hypothetical protein ABWY27_08505 [Telluria sp.]
MEAVATQGAKRLFTITAAGRARAPGDAGMIEAALSHLALPPGEGYIWIAAQHFYTRAEKAGHLLASAEGSYGHLCALGNRGNAWWGQGDGPDACGGAVTT